jgi:hypothetical protein
MDGGFFDGEDRLARWVNLHPYDVAVTRVLCDATHCQRPSRMTKTSM